MTVQEADKLKARIIEECAELRGIAYRQVMDVIDEQTESKCNGCFGAANNDCQECEVN